MIVIIFYTPTTDYLLPLLQIHKQPSINQQLRARNIPAQLIRRQKHRRPRKIARLARPPQRYPSLHVPPLVVVGEVLFVQLRLDGAWEKRIATDAVFSEGAGSRLDERENAGLGRSVVGLSFWGGG